MTFNKNERLILAIDGANLYSAAKSIGYDIDYKRLLKYCSTMGNIVDARYYTALLDSEDYNSITPLLDYLEYNDYSMVTKYAKSFSTEAGGKKVKGNMDIELVVDIMEACFHGRVDHVMLFSGDGDFTTFVAALQRMTVRVTVVSTLGMVADELRRQANHFMELDDKEGTVKRAIGRESNDASGVSQ